MAKKIAKCACGMAVADRKPEDFHGRTICRRAGEGIRTKKERVQCSTCRQPFHGLSECKPAPDSKGNKDQQWVGDELRKSFVSLRKLEPVEAVQDYTITDAITALMHHARKRGLDALELAQDAIDHFSVETTICDACGTAESPELHQCPNA